MEHIGALIVALLLPLVHTDVYLHNPKGSNNRLNEDQRNRVNANRIFNSQNNNRGGYNKGGGKNDDFPMQFIVGSKLQIEWSNQHECGGENTKCDIIIQYMCDPNLRDGTSTGDIDQKDLRDTKIDKGRHESPEYYANCEGRQRNKGLFLADQKLKGDSAKFTRQNNNGGRSGLECPEERDYYPYWAPSPWRDIVVLTDDTSRCREIKRESQNVKAKPYCRFKTVDALKKGKMKKNHAPLTKAECDKLDQSKYGWAAAPAHGLPAPDCLPAPKSRDNHQGNGPSMGRKGTSERIPQLNKYVWTVPDTPAAGCALRIRYNISVLDYNPKTTFSGATINIQGQYGIKGNNRGYEFKNNPTIEPLAVKGKVETDFKLELAINTAQAGRTFQDRTHKFQIVRRAANIPKRATIYNLNIRGRRGNAAQTFPAMEYDFVPNVLNLRKGDYVHPQWVGALTLPKNDAGQGTKGTDINNMILQRPKKYGPSARTRRFANGYPTINFPQKIAGTDGNRVMGFSKEAAERAAVPKEGDAPAVYSENPCDVKSNDELFYELEDDLKSITSLLREINSLHIVANHDRKRRSTTMDELEDLFNVDSLIDMAVNDEEIADNDEDEDEDEDEDSEDGHDLQYDDEDEDEDVDEDSEDSNDPRCKKGKKGRKGRKKMKKGKKRKRMGKKKKVEKTKKVETNITSSVVIPTGNNTNLLSNSSQFDMAEMDTEIDDDDEYDDEDDEEDSEDSYDLQYDDEDEDEDVDEDSEDSNDPQRKKKKKKEKKKMKKKKGKKPSTTTTPSVVTPSTRTKNLVSNALIPLNQNYACKSNDERTKKSKLKQRKSGTVNTQLNDAPAYVDIGPQKAAVTGTWHYFCTRNNAFSNRDQKGTIIVR